MVQLARHQSFFDRALPAEKTHQSEIEKAFRGAVRFDDDAPCCDVPLVVMAFTNRCGSNLLAEDLRLTRSIGGLREHVNGVAAGRMKVRTGAHSFPDHIATLASTQLGGAPAFGLKASWDQLLMLLRWRIDRMFPSLHVIHVERVDVLAQAVSFSIAHQTKRWTSRHAGAGREVVYDRRDIRNRLEGIGNANKLIRQVCSVYGLDTISVRYEDLVAEPGAELTRIQNWLGIPSAPLEPGKTRLRKQAGETNARFMARFRAEEAAALPGATDRVTA